MKVNELTQKFNSMQKGLQANPSLKDIVFDYPTAYLHIPDKLFNELLSKSCKGIDIKVSEASLDLIRFQALVSELEFAKYFLEKNMHVELLSNNGFEGRKAPDIYAKSDSRD